MYICLDDVVVVIVVLFLFKYGYIIFMHLLLLYTCSICRDCALYHHEEYFINTSK